MISAARVRGEVRLGRRLSVPSGLAERIDRVRGNEPFEHWVDRSCRGRRRGALSRWCVERALLLGSGTLALAAATNESRERDLSVVEASIVRCQVLPARAVTTAI